MTEHATIVSVVLFITAVSLLSAAAHTSAGEHSPVYNELQFSSQGNKDLPSYRAQILELPSDEVNNLRLSDLLLLKNSMFDVLSKSNGKDSISYDNDDMLGQSRLTKRVFCNGFTGCGGRFRGRRKQQQPVAEIGKRLLPNYTKRPFCNSYGCFNSGRKRLSPGLITRDAPQSADITEDWLEDKIKKLFCNNLGGCQNIGKRLVVLDPEGATTVNDDQLASVPLSKGLLDKLGGMRRIFSSDFDDIADRRR